MIEIPKIIKNEIEQADIFANSATEELLKTPPDWQQVYEYIEMIGSSTARAVDNIYNITKDVLLREQYLSYLEKEDYRIRDRVVSTIKKVCKSK